MRKAKYIRKKKHTLPLKLRQITSSPSTQVIWMATLSSKLKKVVTKTQGFSMTKDNTLPKPKANQTKHQIQAKTSTPPEVENTRFHQLSLDTPQDKHRPLKQ
jgi:hypothetical protein